MPKEHAGAIARFSSTDILANYINNPLQSLQRSKGWPIEVTEAAKFTTFSSGLNPGSNSTLADRRSKLHVLALSGICKTRLGRKLVQKSSYILTWGAIPGGCWCAVKLLFFNCHS